MKTFKQWMVLGAVAAAMTVAGCQERNREKEGAGMEGTGGAGSSGMESQGTGGTGSSTTPSTGTGGSGKKMDAGTMMDAGTGGSGSVDTIPEDTQQ